MTKTPQKQSTPQSETKKSANSKPLYPIFNFRDNDDYYRAIIQNELSAKKSPSTTNGGKVTKRKKAVNLGKGRRRLPFISAENQYVIDAGQKDIDAIRCKTCNMLYTRGEYTDEQHHIQYHDMFVNSIKFKGWKNERVVKIYEDGSKILSIRHDDPKYMLKKMDDLFTIADLELGINISLFKCIRPDYHLLMYITEKHRIAGFVVGEQIKEANEFLADQGVINIATSVPAEIGISRIWIHNCYRRKGIATRLLDALRGDFNPPKLIPTSAIAFTDPTEEGKAFASRYTGRENILVFQSLSFDDHSPNQSITRDPLAEVEDPW